ncbi:MAG: type II toxin-antitoxin system PemK/MazF family toxin [Bacteroidota bacterium]
MALAFGDVIVVPFPFTDQTAIKRRPAVVVSSDAYNRERPDVILMAITSQVRPAPAVGEVAVVEWRAAGLLKPSVIKPLVTTIEASLVIRQLGTLGSDDQRALREVLAAVFG